MKQKYAWCWIVLGAMLLLAALFLVLYNLHTDRKSGAASAEILTALRQEITMNTPAETEAVTEPVADFYEEYETETETEPPTDPVTELDGRLYAGILTIPSLGVELPVLQDWSYPNLRLAPCRYSGAAAAGNLIVAAHNYSSHFGDIQSLNTGDQIVFTDVAGNVYVYEVLQTEMVGGYDVEAMKSGEEEWDLTLFTCTLSGRSRVSVRAVQAEY